MSTDTITEAPILTAKDFATDQEVRWCPGCGDFYFGPGSKSDAKYWRSQRKHCHY